MATRPKVDLGGKFVLDPAERKLQPRQGEPVTLQPKLYETLQALIDARGALVTKENLIEMVWPDVEVLEGSLTRNIYLLRQLFGEGSIETVAKAGYRLALAVREIAAETSAIQSLAVMPFAMFGAAEDEYIADGLTEEIIDAVVKLPGYKVVGRATSFQFKKRPPGDLRKTGAELGVEAILEGSVRRSGPRFRVTAQLIAVDTGFHLWSETFDREMTDILDLQSEVAGAVVGRMNSGSQPFATPTQRRPSQPSAEAYDRYARGRFLVQMDATPQVLAGIECFRQALALEANYPAANAAAAEAYFRLLTAGFLPAHEGMPKMRHHAELALAADPANAQALTMMACVRGTYNLEFEKADREFRDVIRANPWYGTARYLYTYFLLMPLGRFAEAQAQLDEAAQLDPLSTHIKAARISMPLFAGRVTEAVEAGARIAAQYPNSYLIAIQRAWALMAAMRLDEAAVEVGRAKELVRDDRGLIRGAEGLLEGLRGNFAPALEILKDDPFNKARVLTWMGRRAESLDSLREAVATRAIGLLFLDRLVEFVAYRGSADFEEIRWMAGMRTAPTPGVAAE